MTASLLLRERYLLGEDRFAEIDIRQGPNPVPGSAQIYKYRLAFVVADVCVLRFDNEAGKGDRRHSAGRETEYVLSNRQQSVADFWDAIGTWRAGRDVKSVHGDIRALLKAGVLDRAEDGRPEFAYDTIHVDFIIRAA
ncbi:MAG: DUF6516 family protein [Rhodospirillales bacterium]